MVGVRTAVLLPFCRAGFKSDLLLDLSLYLRINRFMHKMRSFVPSIVICLVMISI